MKKIIILILLLINYISFSQTFKVVDVESKLPIQYATVNLIKDGKSINGFYTDENGYFNLTGFDFTQIIVSCVGYETKKVLFDKNVNTIELEKIIYNLNEVIVTNRKSIQIGYIDEQKTKSLVGVSTGLEVAVFIENKLDYEAIINSIQFSIKKTKERIAYRLHIYKVSDNELKPGEELLSENYIYYIEPKTEGLIDINLSVHNIVLPKNGVFVSIEGIGGISTNTTKSKKNILKFQTYKSSQHIYQERNQLNGVGWININKWLPNNYYETFNLIYDVEKLYVPSFGLKVSKIIND